MRHPSGIDRFCTIPGCHRRWFGHGRCKLHYQQWYRSPEYRRLPRSEAKFLPLADRLWAKVQKTETCWLWQGAIGGGGYGHISVGHGELVKAHRVSYGLAFGPIADGLHIDHRCGNKACVNPGHLDAVTALENTRRYADSRTSCKNGHAWTDENTHFYRGHKACRACHAANERARRARQREQALVG